MMSIAWSLLRGLDNPVGCVFHVMQSEPLLTVRLRDVGFISRSSESLEQLNSYRPASSIFLATHGSMLTVQRLQTICAGATVCVGGLRIAKSDFLSVWIEPTPHGG